MEGERERGIAELFYDAEEKFSIVTAEDCPNEIRTKHVQSAILLLLKVDKQINAEGIISTNEEVDDMNTMDLKYLLVPYYLAELLAAMPSVDGRLKRLQQAVKYFKRHLDACENMGVMEEEDRKRYKNKQTNARPSRDEKISSYKRNKAIEEQIKMLRIKREELKKRRISDEDAEEDDVERSFRLALLQGSVGKSIDQLGFVDQELPMLEHMEKMKKDPAFAREEEKARQERQKTAPKPSMWKITDAKQLANIPPELAGSLTHVAPSSSPAVEQQIRMQQRQQQQMQQMQQGIVAATNFQSTATAAASARAQVFRDPNPCTQSLDDWVTQQQQLGILPTPSNETPSHAGHGHMHSHVHENEDEDYEGDADEDELDAKNLKDRNWDNWKDDNEKGVGNRMDRW